jgi:hypothetical protein
VLALEAEEWEVKERARDMGKRRRRKEERREVEMKVWGDGPSGHHDQERSCV